MFTFTWFFIPATKGSLFFSSWTSYKIFTIPKAIPVLLNSDYPIPFPFLGISLEKTDEIFGVVKLTKAKQDPEYMPTT
jgi:hypothetical protein